MDYKYGTIYRTIVTTPPTDLCDLMRGVHGNPIFQMMIEVIQESVSTLFHRCLYWLSFKQISIDIIKSNLNITGDMVVLQRFDEQWKILLSFSKWRLQGDVSRQRWHWWENFKINFLYVRKVTGQAFILIKNRFKWSDKTFKIFKNHLLSISLQSISFSFSTSARWIKRRGWRTERNTRSLHDEN